MEAADSEMDKCCRAEIDTSAPIESVREAANLFGGIGYWKPQIHPKLCHQIDFNEQAAELEKEMLVKERETLEVLEELEKTKLLVEQLKTRLQNETSELNLAVEVSEAEKVNKVEVGGNVGIPSSAPGFVLLELKRAKANLVKSSNDLTHLRAAVESYTQRIEEERKALEAKRESLVSNVSEVSRLEKDLNETRQKLQLAKDDSENDHETANQIEQELQRLSVEAAEFRKVGEAAKSEVLRAMAEIEMAKATLHTVEMRLIAARKAKEAARASEALAIADVKALTNVDGDEVTLSAEEYSCLKSKAIEAEEKCKSKVEDAMVLVDEANLSKAEILRRVKEATEEVKTTKMALEEVLQRVEAANKDKLDLDKALRKKRSEHCRHHRRRSVHKSCKFKNSCQSRRTKVCGLDDLKSEWSEPAMRPTLSIGQILSQKLLHPVEHDANTADDQPNENTAPDVSLRKMLNINKNENVSKSIEAEDESGVKQLCAKRKTFGLGRFSILLSKQSKKKKTIPSFKYCTGKTNPHDRLSFG
ncbi:unnamed protein product [Rhodiola kirilowii]